MKLQYYTKFLSFFRSEMKRLLDQVVSDLVFRNYGPPMSPSVKASWVDPNCTGWLSTISESPSSPILLTLGSGQQKQPFVNPHPPPQSLSQPWKHLYHKWKLIYLRVPTKLLITTLR